MRLKTPTLRHLLPPVYGYLLHQGCLKAKFLDMLRSHTIKIACVLMLVGFAAGVTGQVELLKPGISFMSKSFWPKLLTLHVWATSISLVAICLSTISFIRYKTTFGQWGVWLGFGIVPFAIGALMYLVLAKTRQPDGVLLDTTYASAYRHAFGTLVLLIALGGLSAWKKTKAANLSLTVSFAFALSITITSVTLVILQARLGLMGMPREYIDYNPVFASFQFYSSIAAIACLSLSAGYVFRLMWLPDDDLQKVEDSF